MVTNLKNNKLLSFITDNLNLIIIVPAILGGLWQIIELSILSLSFLRFFSVTQLVADGILIMLIFSIIIGSVLLLPIYSFWIIPQKDDLKEIINKEQKKPISYMDKSPIISIIVFYGLIFLIAYGIGNYVVISIKELLIYTLVGFFSIYIVRNLYLNERRNSIKYKKIVYLCTLFVFYIMFLYVGIFCIHIHQLFLLPQNLTNIEKLKGKLRKENIEDDIEILYTNDKYIFIELKNKKSKKTKMEIVSFEDLTKK